MENEGVGASSEDNLVWGIHRDAVANIDQVVILVLVGLSGGDPHG